MIFNRKSRPITLLLIILLPLVMTSGCASVGEITNPDDPWETYNRGMYDFNDKLDKTFLKPVAKGYNYVMPKFINKGISNFFSNLDDVLVMFNNIFQLKLLNAASDFARVVTNSTIGLLGTIDFAKHIDLHKHNEDFGQTLGYWGVPSGPYLVLPLLGPSSVRDTGGFVGDSLHTNPLFYVDDSATFWTLAATKIIDQRANLIIATETIDETALDPYSFIRDAYLSRRLYLVHDGNPPQDKDEIFDEDDLFNDDDLFKDDELL